MRCNDYQSRLSALVDGEVTSFGAWSVRRHLSGCAECRATHSTLTHIDTISRAQFQNAVVPASLQERFLSEADQGVVSTETRPRRRVTRGLALTSAAVALLGFVIGGSSLYFSLQSKPAYAEIERAMQAAPFRTIHMKGIWGPSDAVIAPYVEEVWARTQRPASVSIESRSGQRPPSKTTQDVGGMVYRYTFHGKACKYERDNPVHHRWSDAYFRKWVVDKAMAPSIDSDRKFNWEQTTVLRAGKRLIRLDGTKPLWFFERVSPTTATLFVDPKTHLVVRSERHYLIDGHEFFWTWTNIAYNETPPPHTFDDADKPNLP